MTNPIHVAPDVFDNKIIAARMKEDAYGHLIATGTLYDVTDEAMHAAAYRLYRIAKEEGSDKVAYEYVLRNGTKVILAARIEKKPEEEH